MFSLGKRMKNKTQLYSKGNTNRKIFLMKTFFALSQKDPPERQTAHAVPQMGNQVCSDACSITTKGAAFASVSDEILPHVRD